MSVVKSKRGEGKLVVITKARELAEYTLRICANENSFPKRYRWCLTNKIVDSAMTIHNSANMANSIYIYDENDYALRKRYQTIALAETYALLGMIDIAFKVYRTLKTEPLPRGHNSSCQRCKRDTASAARCRHGYDRS